MGGPPAAPAPAGPGRAPRPQGLPSLKYLVSLNGMDRHRPSLSYQHLLVYSPETDQLAGLDVGDDAVLAPPLTQREVVAPLTYSKTLDSISSVDC